MLDFGLAKLAGSEAETAATNSSQAATLTTPAATRMGVIMGTAAYMSPEQAKGKPIDKRTDIWAFGCVLYEMLTGKRAFAAHDVADTLAFILTKDVDWDALPPNTSTAVGRLLRRCLDKDVRGRLRDIGEARIGIAEYLADPAATSSAGTLSDTTRHKLRERLAWGVASILVAATLAVSFVHFSEDAHDRAGDACRDQHTPHRGSVLSSAFA